MPRDRNWKDVERNFRNVDLRDIDDNSFYFDEDETKIFKNRKNINGNGNNKKNNNHKYRYNIDEVLENKFYLKNQK